MAVPRPSASLPAAAPSSGRAAQLFDPEAAPEAGGDVDDQAGGGGSAEERAGVLSIGGLYDEVEAALAQSFPRRRHLWVRGEIQHLSDHRSGHLYLDLVDPEEDSGRGGARGGRGGQPVLKVKCWRTSWTPLRHSLGKEGIELAEGMVVVLRGSLDLYRAKGELSFVLADIDVTALLGRLAAQRTALLRALETEGLLRRNAGVALPDVVLHVGLVASPETEGCRDFLGQLTGSGFGFRVSHVKVPVQGPAAGRRRSPVPSRCWGAAAVTSSRCARRRRAGRPGGVRVGGRGACRGGVRRAGVDGHRAHGRPERGRCRRGAGVHHADGMRTGDRGADAGLVERSRGRAGVGVGGAGGDVLVGGVGARRGLRGRLAATACQQLRVHGERVARSAASVSGRAAALERSEGALRERAGRLGPAAVAQLERRSEQARGWRRLLAAYDVDRQLERGYSLTLAADGSLVRSAGDMAPGAAIVTRLADGTVRSTVDSVEETGRVDVHGLGTGESTSGEGAA